MGVWVVPAVVGIVYSTAGVIGLIEPARVLSFFNRHSVPIRGANRTVHTIRVVAAIIAAIGVVALAAAVWILVTPFS